MSISRRKRFDVFKRDHFTCQYCGRRVPRVTLEVDHRVPRCRGGSDHMDNLLSSCVDCNRGKAGIPLFEGARRFRLADGPLEGVYVESRKILPALWVFRLADGTIRFAEDGLIVDPEADPDEPYADYPYRFEYGHPGTRPPTRGGVDWFQQPWPKMEGMYWVSGEGETDLSWCDMETVILNLT